MSEQELCDIDRLIEKLIDLKKNNPSELNREIVIENFHIEAYTTTYTGNKGKCFDVYNNNTFSDEEAEDVKHFEDVRIEVEPKKIKI